MACFQEVLLMDTTGEERVSLHPEDDYDEYDEGGVG